MSARDVIADYMSQNVFAGEDCESCDEDNKCTKTCSQYTIDCVGHADQLHAFLRSAGFAVVPVEPTGAMVTAYMLHKPGLSRDLTGAVRESIAAAIKAAQEDSRE